MSVPDLSSTLDRNFSNSDTLMRSGSYTNGLHEKPVDANCAKKTHPALGVKRLSLKSLLSSNGCGIDHTEPHRLRFHVAILITGGSDEHMVDFSPVALKAGNLLLLRAGQAHAFAKDHSLEGEILTFTPDFIGTLAHIPSLSETIDALFEAGPCVSLAENSAGFARKWYEDFSEELALRGRPFSEPRIACSFGLLIHRLAALPEFALFLEEGHTPRPRLIREFRTLLGNNFVDRRDPAWYADQLHVSTRTLDRQLMKTVNQTCKQLIKDRLLLEAKRLLTDPDLQVKSVAYALRFDEVANFSRFFHQNAGLTPRDFKSHTPDWPH